MEKERARIPAKVREKAKIKAKAKERDQAKAKERAKVKEKVDSSVWTHSMTIGIVRMVGIVVVGMKAKRLNYC